MFIDRQFHNIKCDACGRLIDDETWWDDKDALTTQILNECNWIECEGRHYCDECWEYDDDDNIVTKDGRKWDDYNHKEIKEDWTMKLSEDIRKEIWQMASDPESVCYIEKHDGEGFKVEEIDGDYCHLCATEKARELDKEDGGKYYHQVYEETSPESDHFSHCAECGCLLNAALIVSSWNEDDINYIVEDLKQVKSFEDIKGDLAWIIDNVLDNEDEACELFPKQMKYIARRLTNLYKKQTRLTGRGDTRTSTKG